MYDAKETRRGTLPLLLAGAEPRSRSACAGERAAPARWRAASCMLHWQPMIGTRSRGGLVGAEALVRWQHPERGLLMPERVRPAGRGVRPDPRHRRVDAGAGAVAGRRLARARRRGAVVRAQRLRRRAGAGRRLRRAAAPARCATNGVPGSRIELEVTERVLMSHLAGERRDPAAHRRPRGALAIDDFGTGYSSLAYLRLLPVDKLKIDQLLPARDRLAPADEAIVRAIAALARTLGLGVAGEGVETEAQLERAARAGLRGVAGALLQRAAGRLASSRRC